jgi:hypothetical protein
LVAVAVALPSAAGLSADFLAAAFLAGAFFVAGSVTLALVRAADRAAAGTARVVSAGSFSDELDDTYYLSSDGFGLLMLRGMVNGWCCWGRPADRWRQHYIVKRPSSR